MVVTSSLFANLSCKSAFSGEKPAAISWSYVGNVQVCVNFCQAGVTLNVLHIDGVHTLTLPDVRHPMA